MTSSSSNPSPIPILNLNPWFTVILLFGILSGCELTTNYWQASPVKVSESDQLFVEQIYQHLHARELEQVAEMSKANIDYWHNMESRFIAWFPQEPISAFTVVGGSEVVFNGNNRQTNVSLQIRHKKTFVLFEAALIGSMDNRKLASFQIQNGVKRIDVNNSTAWRDATGLHVVVMCLMLIIPVFMLYSFFHCWRNMHGGKKVFWLVFILLSVTRFKVNWGSGDFELWWQSVSILGVWFQSPGDYHPMGIGVALPLGALMYWMFKDQINQQTLPQEG